jgi:hypothetical protein
MLPTLPKPEFSKSKMSMYLRTLCDRELYALRVPRGTMSDSVGEDNLRRRSMYVR